MIERRDFISSALLCIVAARHASAQEYAIDDFDRAFAKAEENPSLNESQQEREGFAAEYLYYLTRTTTPRVSPSNRRISDRARNLIILFEVTNEARYMERYRNPVWPKGASGLTIGIGYDIGYVKPAWLEEDWAGILSKEIIDRLKMACGVSGASAKTLLPKLRDIEVDWKSAEHQFRTLAVPRWTAVTESALPNTDQLSDDSLGALVSLVYNRGPSFRKTGPRYVHMRAIRRLLISRQFTDIPSQIEAMKVLWAADGPVAGLRTRRDLEARLFRAGLKP